MITSERYTPTPLVFSIAGMAGSFPQDRDFEVVTADGTTTISLTISQVTSEVGTATYTPVDLGLHHLVLADTSEIVESVYVMPQSLTVSLETIKDAVLGSWSHDKATGMLQLYSRQGVLLHEYTVVDNVDVTSKTLI